jgi:preprotein translocase subunit SecG
MYDVLIAIHVFVAIALIGVVLIQRSEGGGLGIGTSQGMGAFMSGRGTANLLTRATAILAGIFMALSLGLALMNRNTAGAGGVSILNTPMPTTTPSAPGQVGVVPAQPQPNTPKPTRATPGPGGPPAGADVPH